MSLDTVEYRGYNIFVNQETMLDDDFVNPRKSMDNLGTMVCFHSKYNLGDDHDFDNPRELMEFIREENVISLPLFVLDHGNIAMRTRDYKDVDPQGWDWGQTGIIYVTMKGIEEEYGNVNADPTIIDKVYEVLKAEVETYSNFISGDVYIIDIHDTEGELIESINGIIGTHNLYEAKRESQAIVDNLIEKEAYELLPENKYVARVRCPNCKRPLSAAGITLGAIGHYMSLGDYKTPYRMVTQKVACKKCSYEWQEKYELKLVGYETIKTENHKKE